MRPFSVNSLAERWGCRPDTVYRMIRDGQLQAFRLGGKLIRIRWEEVERFECQSTALSGTGGRYSLAFTDGERGRVRIALGTNDRGLAEARARDIWNARHRPQSERIADLWPAYERDRATVIARPDALRSTWKALEPHFGHRLGKAITADDCREYERIRKRAGKRPSTIRTELEMLRACLRFYYGPAAPKLHIPAASAPRDRWLTKADVAKLLDNAAAPHARLFIVLAVTTARAWGPFWT